MTLEGERCPRLLFAISCILLCVLKKAVAGYLCFVATLGALFAGTLYVRWSNLDADLRLAGALLADGQSTQVRDLLRPHLQGSLRLSELGTAHRWADLLDSASIANSQTEQLLAVRSSPFAEALILLRLLRLGQFETVADIVSSSAPEVRRRFTLFERVARLELGDTSVLRGLDREVRTELAARIEEVQALRSQGAQQIIRDRSGRLVGAMDADGVFQPTLAAQDLGLDLWLPRAVAEFDQVPGLRLTLDLELTRAAQRLLGRGRGSIVVLDSRTGSVLAATSDARTLAREGAAFLEQALEPGSIAKLITTSAALRAGLDVDSEIRSKPCAGSVEVEDGRLYCPVVAGRLKGLDQAMAISCNTTFARLGAKIGKSLLLDELRMFGFSTDPDMANTASKLRSTIDTRRKLAEVSIGLNHSQLTPIHAARIAAVFANGGHLPEPRWIWAEDGCHPSFNTDAIWPSPRLWSRASSLPNARQA